VTYKQTAPKSDFNNNFNTWVSFIYQKMAW